ncbi:MAG: DUF11 domain-containing protein, partial [Planctomycetes bacterium]|nr:DUF11 domain-containing protein [Planctomycetota bacterium]
GSIGPGETRRVRLALAAAKGGSHELKVEARGDTELVHAAAAEVEVIAPSIQVALTGPGLRYIGRNAVYRVNVANDGTAPSNQIRVEYQVPEGFTFVRAGQSGSYDNLSRAVVWFVDRLDAGKTTELDVELTAARLGSFEHVVAATTEQGLRAENRLASDIDGTASLVLEIVDLDDPIEVGAETAYEIRVRNDGSRSAQNVVLSCELPPGVDLLDAKGPTESAAGQGRVRFGALPELPPGKTALYRVNVRGTSEGHRRFRALLASDSIHEPLTVEELTRFYGE